MCLTMVDTAACLFEMAELPVIEIFKTDGDDVKMAEQDFFLNSKASQQIVV